MSINDILDRASKECSTWPIWKFSEEIRHEFETMRHEEIMKRQQIEQSTVRETRNILGRPLPCLDLTLPIPTERHPKPH